MNICCQLALIYVAVAAVQPACERANGNLSTPFVIIPTFDMPLDDLAFIRSTLSKHSCIDMAANTQEFLDPFTAVKKGRDHNATSLGIVLSDTGATGVVQFANAMLAAPTDYFSGTKIILVERNPFFNAVTSVVEPLVAKRNRSSWYLIDKQGGESRVDGSKDSAYLSRERRVFTEFWIFTCEIAPFNCFNSVLPFILLSWWPQSAL